MDSANPGDRGFSDADAGHIHDLPSVDALVGLDVCDVAGEKIGTVADAYTETDAGDLRYLAVATGWLGVKRHLIPIDDVRLEDDGEDRFLVLPYEKELLREGPAFDEDDEVTRGEEDRIYGHYGRTGYWDPVRARQTAPAPTPEIAEAEMQDALDRGDDPNTVAVKRWGV